jgi:hypothetical protein
LDPVCTQSVSQRAVTFLSNPSTQLTTHSTCIHIVHREDLTSTVEQISIPLRHSYSKVFTKAQASEESNEMLPNLHSRVKGIV